MLDDETKYVIIQTEYESNMLFHDPKFYHDFSVKHDCQLLFFVANNNFYKPNPNNSWDQNNYTTDEHNFMTTIRNLEIRSFIVFKILESDWHNYATVFKLLADVQDLDICAIFGCEMIDFTTVKDVIIITFDAEAG